MANVDWSQKLFATMGRGLREDYMGTNNLKAGVGKALEKFIWVGKHVTSEFTEEYDEILKALNDFYNAIPKRTTSKSDKFVEDGELPEEGELCAIMKNRDRNGYRMTQSSWTEPYRVCIYHNGKFYETSILEHTRIGSMGALNLSVDVDSLPRVEGTINEQDVQKWKSLGTSARAYVEKIATLRRTSSIYDRYAEYFEKAAEEAGITLKELIDEKTEALEDLIQDILSE